MKKLSKEKRNRLIMIVIGTVAILAMIGFGLIKAQYAVLANIAEQKADAEKKLESINKILKGDTSTQDELTDLTNQLSHAEDDMATGDLYSWFADTIHRLTRLYQVDIPEIDSPRAGEVDMLTSFPYKQARFNVSGTAYYHDLGKFIADFENGFPHARMVNLVLEPAASSESKNEKLSFKMDIIILVK